MNPAFAASVAPAYEMVADDLVHTETLTGIDTPVRGVFSAPSEAVLDDAVIATPYSVRYSVAAWPVVTRGDNLRIDGVDYTVREDPRLLLDGLEAIIPLELAWQPA